MLNRRDALRALAVGTTASPALVSAATRSTGVGRPDPDTIARLPELMELSLTPGIAIGVLRDGRLAWERGFGIADRTSDRPVDARTIWIAASLSKQAVLYAVLRLVAAGRMDLDQSLSGYLGDAADLADTAAQITTRHVLTHTSGLPNWRRDGLVRPEFSPGSRFQYSGEGYYLLGRAIERVTGRGFEASMRELVFEPLGMSSSTFLWRPELKGRVVSGHRGGEPFTNIEFAETLDRRVRESGLPLAAWDHGRVAALIAKDQGGREPMPADILYPNPAFSLLTTASDYARLIERLLQPRGDALDVPLVLLDQVFRPHIRVNSRLSWGLGLGLERAGESYGWQWGNNAGAWTNLLLLHRPTASGILIFTNGGNGLRVAERLVSACTGVEHPLFLYI